MNRSVDPSLEAALEEHLEAIRRRDLEALRATVSHDLTLVTAEGEVVRGLDRFLELHEEWFRDDRWRMDTELVAAQAGANLALCVLELSYRERAEASPAMSVLTLAFTRAGERWLLVFDQNTPARRS